MPSSPLLDTLRNQLTPDLISRSASHLGESESVVSKAFVAAIPALLAALIAKIGDGSFLRRLFGMLTSSSLDSSTVASPSSLLGAIESGSSSPLAQLSNEFLSSALGGQTRPVADAVASASGARSSTASSVLTLAAPLLLSTLARRARNDELDAAGLANLLLGQKSAILAAAPPGIAALFGGDPRRAVPAAPPVREAASGASRWLWGLALLIGLFALWSLLRDRDREEPVASLQPPPVAAAPQVARVEAPPPPPPPANIVERRLPSGTQISMPRGSLEDSLVQFLESNNPIDDTAWIDFDRLLFDTASATLQPQSREQLRNVAAVLQAYPSIKVKIGGYTDDVGDDAANQALSEARATSVRSELIALGIPNERLEAAGYGEEHPVASNATEEGRQRNRRIALLVVER